MCGYLREKGLKFLKFFEFLRCKGFEWSWLLVWIGFFSFPVPLLLPLGLLKVVKATPEMIFLDPEGTQRSWWHPIPYLKAGLSWFVLHGGYLPLCSRVCWDWIWATLGFWGLAESGQSKVGGHVKSGTHQRAPQHFPAFSATLLVFAANTKKKNFWEVYNFPVIWGLYCD